MKKAKFNTSAVDKKKIVVIYGNCHTTVISQLLSKCPEFLQEYEIYPILPICHIESKEYFDLPVFRKCDAFVHQSIRIENSYGPEYASENIISLLKPECKIISIPNVYHLPMCFFPQYSPEKEFVKRNAGTVFFRDSVIDRLYSQGLGKKKIIKQYEEASLFAGEELGEAFEAFMDKVKMREKDWDIKVSDFISENYKNVRLFFDPNHPTPCFFQYIAKHILALLDIHFDEGELDKQKVLVLDSFEMPVCASVKIYFGMNFEDGELRRSGMKVRQGEMYLEEYISQYLAMEWQNKSLSWWLRLKSFVCFSGIKIYNNIIFKMRGRRHVDKNKNH